MLSLLFFLQLPVMDTLKENTTCSERNILLTCIPILVFTHLVLDTFGHMACSS